MATAMATIIVTSKNNGFAKIALPRLINVEPNCFTDLIAEPNEMFPAFCANVPACFDAVSKSNRAKDAPTSPIPSPNTENPRLSASMSTCLSTSIIV